LEPQGIFETDFPNYTVSRGKVRDIYEFGETMYIIITTDRVSAYDWVFPETVIPDKGRILNKLSCYWTDALDVYYHMISNDFAHLPQDFNIPELKDRIMLVEKAEVIPFECVVRGYLAGSGWKDYKETGKVCGVELPPGLKENQQLPKPIFTPATKATSGHDENVSFEYMEDKIGTEMAAELEARSLELYTDAAEIAWKKGIIIADTKFEWGILRYVNDELVLIDEVLTPDSSRFWAIEDYEPGKSIPSFDKQFVRDYIAISGWDKASEPPPLPGDIIMKTREKYIEAYEKITGEKFDEIQKPQELGKMA